MIGNVVVQFLNMEEPPHLSYQYVCNEEFVDMLEEFRGLFNSVPGVAKVEEFRIYTSNDISIRTPPRMIPQAYYSDKGHVKSNYYTNFKQSMVIVSSDRRKERRRDTILH